MKLDDVGTRISTQITPSFVVDVNPLPNSTPTQLMERVFNIGDFTWSTTDATGPGPFQVFYPFALLAIQPLIDDVLSYYQYIKTDMEIQFRLQTTQFYQGSLMFTAVPFDYSLNVPLSTSIYSRSWQRPVILSAQCEDSVILKLPWLRPTRFETPAYLQVAGQYPWTVMVDILTPLRVANASAPNLVTVQVVARFVNPHLIWPIPPPGSFEKEMRLNPKKQSKSSSADKIAPARGVAQRVHVPRGSSNPVDQAKSTIGTASSSAMGTVVSSIDSVANTVMSVLDSISPLAELAGLFLDKPQMPDESARMFIAPATNFVASDVRDQGYSLSLYKTAYMGTNTDTLPESSDVSWLAIAMRPALHFVDSLQNSTPNNVRTYFSHPTTTPFGWAISSHLFWRGSVRYHINFYASTFVSGRILIVYSPPSVGVITTINNTISRLVAIKGDTTVEFTIPFVSQTDFQPVYYPNVGGTFSGTGVLTFSVYGVITSADSSTDATIDYAVWTAASPDAQFMQPLASPLYQLSNLSLDVRKQADICKAFQNTFPPYVDGCEYLTDSGYVASEISRSPMDVLKRYQFYAANLPPNTVLPGLYVPDSSTLGYQIRTAFLYQRGGVNYKVFPTYTNQTDIIAPANIAAAKWTLSPYWPFNSGDVPTNSATGLPYLTVGQSDSEIDISVPYTNQYPFVYTNETLPFTVPAGLLVTPRANPTSFAAGPPVTPNYLIAMDVYTSVRDDYMMGWLLAPLPFNEVPSQSKSALKADSQSQPASNDPGTQPQHKQLSMLDFVL